jgi:hypothetical protein
MDCFNTIYYIDMTSGTEKAPTLTDEEATAEEQRKIEAAAEEQRQKILDACGGELPMAGRLEWKAPSVAVAQNTLDPETPVGAVVVATYGLAKDPKECAYFLAHGVIRNGKTTRDEQREPSVILSFTYGEWVAFIEGMADGEFDLDTVLDDADPTDAPDQSHSTPRRPGTRVQVDETGRLAFEASGEPEPAPTLPLETTQQVLGQAALSGDPAGSSAA